MTGTLGWSSFPRRNLCINLCIRNCSQKGPGKLIQGQPGGGCPRPAPPPPPTNEGTACCQRPSLDLPARMRPSALLLAALLCAHAAPTSARWSKNNKKWKKGGGGGKADGPPPPLAPHDYDNVDCPKCMTLVLRLMNAGARGCPAANSTLVKSTNPSRMPTAFCETLLPKRRTCIAYSFGLDGTWDFDKVGARPPPSLPLLSHPWPSPFATRRRGPLDPSAPLLLLCTIHSPPDRDALSRTRRRW
jgi:hypothetical protein